MFGELQVLSLTPLKMGNGAGHLVLHDHRINHVDNVGYPDDTFVDTLFDEAQQGGCEGDLLLAFRYSLSAE